MEEIAEQSGWDSKGGDLRLRALHLMLPLVSGVSHLWKASEEGSLILCTLMTTLMKDSRVSVQLCSREAMSHLALVSTGSMRTTSETREDDSANFSADSDPSPLVRNT